MAIKYLSRNQSLFMSIMFYQTLQYLGKAILSTVNISMVTTSLYVNGAKIADFSS